MIERGGECVVRGEKREGEHLERREERETGESVGRGEKGERRREERSN